MTLLDQSATDGCVIVVPTRADRCRAGRGVGAAMMDVPPPSYLTSGGGMNGWFPCGMLNSNNISTLLLNVHVEDVMGADH